MACHQSNMLASITVPAGSVTGTAGTHLYKYDALGRRIAKTTDSTGTPFTTVYVHVGQQVFAEYQSSQPYSNPLRKYAYGSYVDEPVLLVDRTAAGAVEAGTEERLYYHRNQQYSITALTDNSGAVVERYAYTAYGEPTILDAAGTTARTSSAYGNPYLYTARAYDSESGLYYFRARMYEGRKGRFLSHDPIGYPTGPNSYAGFFAVSSVDPSGMLDEVIQISDNEFLDWWYAQTICGRNSSGLAYRRDFRTTSGTGCVGKTFVTLGYPSPDGLNPRNHIGNPQRFPFPNLSNCYTSRQAAEKRMAEMNSRGECGDCEMNVYGKPIKSRLIAVAWLNGPFDGPDEIEVPRDGDRIDLNPCIGAIVSTPPGENINFDFACQFGGDFWIGGNYGQGGVQRVGGDAAVKIYPDDLIEEYFDEYFSTGTFNELHWCAVCEASWSKEGPISKPVPGVSK